MCGRTACTLNPNNIRRACAYKDKRGELKEPEWVDAPCGGTYKPSANIPPTAYTPILYQAKHDADRVLQPMMWGIVPPWFKGSDPKGHGLTTNNARLEGLEDSKLYKGCLKHRCVVVCDGMYEWKRDGPTKQPYIVYTSQDGHDIEEMLLYSQDPDSKINQGEWKGPKLTKMAGLYSVWKKDDGTPVYNYTVLTRESNKVLDWLHHRMPCFLSDSDVEEWLDPNTTVKRALEILKVPKEGELSWHPVSHGVGSVKNQELDLIKKVDLVKKEEKAVSKASKNLMSNWLKRPAKDTADEKSKKPKEEGVEQ